MLQTVAKYIFESDTLISVGHTFARFKNSFFKLDVKLTGSLRDEYSFKISKNLAEYTPISGAGISGYEAVTAPSS